MGQCSQPKIRNFSKILILLQQEYQYAISPQTRVDAAKFIYFILLFKDHGPSLDFNFMIWEQGCQLKLGLQNTNIIEELCWLCVDRLICNHEQIPFDRGKTIYSLKDGRCKGLFLSFPAYLGSPWCSVQRRLKAAHHLNGPPQSQHLQFAAHNSVTYPPMDSRLYHNVLECVMAFVEFGTIDLHNSGGFQDSNFIDGFGVFPENLMVIVALLVLVLGLAEELQEPRY